MSQQEAAREIASPNEPFEAGGRRMHAQPGKMPAIEVAFHGRAAESGLDQHERKGAASGALSQGRRTGSRDPAAARRFDGTIG